MSAREELTKHYGGESEHWHGLLDAYRAEVLREAMAAVSGEKLHDRTGTPEDEAYDGGVDDAWRAVRDLIPKPTPPGT